VVLVLAVNLAAVVVYERDSSVLRAIVVDHDLRNEVVLDMAVPHRVTPFLVRAPGCTRTRENVPLSELVHQ
jgi:hypothetical protein